MPTPTGQVFDSSNLTFQFAEIQPQFNQPTIRRPVMLAPSTNFPAGTMIGEITATPGIFGAYAHANSDGTQKWTAILPREVTTDANGNIYRSHTAASESNYSEPSTPAYFSGAFKTGDLPNWDGTNGAADGPAAATFLNKLFIKF